MNRLAALLILLATPVLAEPDCVPPELPPCAVSNTVWADEELLADCQRDMERHYEALDEYRFCLYDYRDDALFLVDRLLAQMIADMAAYRQFSNCRVRAMQTGGSAMACPLPDFVTD